MKIAVHSRRGSQPPERRPTGTLTARANTIIVTVTVYNIQAAQGGKILKMKICLENPLSQAQYKIFY